jgi:hypothetical protein
MHIEIALDTSRTSRTPRTDRSLMHTGLDFLRASSEHWYSIKWTLRMFDVIISKLDLTLIESNGMNPEESCVDQFARRTNERRYEESGDAEMIRRSPANATAEHSDGVGFIGLGNTFNLSSGFDADPLFDSLIVGEDPEKWLDDLLTEDAFAFNNI